MRTRFEFSLDTIKTLLTSKDTKKELSQIVQDRIAERKREASQVDRVIKKLTR